MPDSPSGRRATALLAATATTLMMLLACTAGARAASTVTIHGNAYAFIFAGNESRLEGATIGIAEIPGLTTTAGPNGAYALEVPDDRSLTPYAEFDGYYTTHVQTFHTSGRDLKQVNFQMPRLDIYEALAAVAGAEADPDSGRLVYSAVVSTFFEIGGRHLPDFDAFHDYRPHGVAGSTARLEPAAAEPIYFNADVIPEPGLESSSRDGGVLWKDLPPGTYRVTGSNPEKTHAGFTATCEPGRLVNANPPWGLYELAEGETADPATDA
jgi:hypothetical protein